MIDPTIFFRALLSRDISFFTGVPDSLLSSLCSVIQDNSDLHCEHIIAANEGNAIAIACGYHVATKKIAAVYLQNSGLGNTINPLVSLADPNVYRIPLLLVVGWRGEPGCPDEPQHLKQGSITEAQLDLLGIPHEVLRPDSGFTQILERASTHFKEKGSPFCILCTKNVFSEYSGGTRSKGLSGLSREQALSEIISSIDKSSVVVSTTGKTSRELVELRALREDPLNDFLMVGSMGHALSFSLGVAVAQPQKTIICLDGDGSLLMHMGSLPVTAARKPSNLIHILLNNSAHESVGGQPTIAQNIDFKRLVLASGYEQYFSAESISSLRAAIKDLNQIKNGPVFFEIKISVGSRSNLGRPRLTPVETKINFMKALDA